ncbi:MAG: hypothetical protein U0893_12470 [Chloroflexota bacterium]
MYAWILPRLTWLASASRMPVSDMVPVPAWFADQGPLPTITTASAAQLHAGAASELAIAFAALFTAYFLAVQIVRGAGGWFAAIITFGVAVLLQALAVVAPFALSGDLYSYAMYGRIFSVHSASPYLQPPIQFSSDPFYPYVFWMHVPSFYGPLWTEISGAVSLVVGADVGLTILVYRSIAAVSVLLAMALVYLLLRHLDPERALAGAVLLGWCPFVVVESGLGGHNDALMGFLMVLGLVLAAQRSSFTRVAAVGAVVLAGLVKITALALLPLLGLYLLRTAPSWRARFAIAVGSMVVAAGIGAAVILPVWVGPATFAVQSLGSSPDRYVNSLGEVALGELRVQLGATRDDLEVPLQFSGWWVGVHTETSLFASRTGTDVVGTLPVWSNLLVVGPEREHRLRVFDPVSRKIGFVGSEALGPIDPPAELANDPEIQARIQGPVGAPDLLEANREIRQVGWAVFGLAFVLALAFGTRSFARLIVAWAALCLVLAYATLTWFWPWYVLAGLMPATMLPRSRMTRLTLYVGWGVLLAYVLLGFQDTRFWYLHSYRSIAMFGLPLVLFLADELLRGIGWLARLAFKRERAVRTMDPRVRSRLSDLTG